MNFQQEDWAMILIALGMTLLELQRLGSEAAKIDQLIQQLGSDIFAEREAATNSLKSIGLTAFEPLRRATENADEAEIRRRAQLLVTFFQPRANENRALTIRHSRLSPEEKAKRLKPFLSEGMTGDQVVRLLGKPTTVLSFISGDYTYHYPEYDLSIFYNADFKVRSFR
jgi:hypothetical protein